MRADRLIGSVEGIRRKLRALSALARNAGATEHERANAEALKARLQQSDGTYRRALQVVKDAPSFSAQDFLTELAEGKAEVSSIPAAKSHAVTSKPAPRKPAAEPATAAD